MTLLRAYLALSVDGYIADRDGGVAWLERFHSPEIDYAEFSKTIGAAVVGRRTYDQAIEGGWWRPPAETTVILTHRPIVDAPESVESFAGDVRELADRLRRNLQESGKDVWLMGGGESLWPFHEAGCVDRWELFYIPVLLGEGVPLFPRCSHALEDLRLTHSKAYSNGILEARYEPAGG